MTTAGIPLVRVEIDTDQATADLWAKARTINPSKMEWAVPVRSVPTTDGKARIIVAVSQDRYAHYVAGVGIQDAPAAIENGLLQVSIRDLTGKPWLNQIFNTARGIETMETLETAALPTGMYLIQVSSGKAAVVFKAIKA